MGSFGFGFGGHGSDEEMADGGAGFGASPPRTRERPQEVVDLPLPLEALYTGEAGDRWQLRVRVRVRGVLHDSGQYDWQLLTRDHTICTAVLGLWQVQPSG
jgi:hypothetical protein